MCPNENPRKSSQTLVQCGFVRGPHVSRPRPFQDASNDFQLSGERSGAYIKVDPMFDALRADARYPELLRLMARAAARSSRDLRAS